MTSTVLVWAANNGHLACVVFLVEQGADDEAMCAAALRVACLHRLSHLYLPAQ